MQEKQTVINQIIHAANARGGSFHQRYAAAKNMLWDAQCDGDYPVSGIAYDEAIRQFDRKLGGQR